MHKLLKKSNIKIMKSNMANFIKMYKNNAVTKFEIYRSIEGWNAYAMHASTYKLRRKIMKKIKNL